MKRTRRWIVLAAGFFAARAIQACEVRHIDLGPTGDEAGLGPRQRPGGDLATAYGCGDWIDAELNALRAGRCEGHCSEAASDPYVIDSKPKMMAATAGRWTFCSGHLGPADAIGVELGPGCRIFFLRDDEAGIAVRGTEAAYQADYDIFDSATPAIDLHFSPTVTEAFSVEAYRCPERVVLRNGERVVELARFEGHGGTGTSVR